MQINIDVAGRKAYSPSEEIVCGNSDYEIRFNFTSEWDAFPTKTARFIFNGHTRDVVFTGNVCPAPIITNTLVCAVGVYAGNLQTTTPALVKCRKSILCDGGTPEDPEESVYLQILAALESKSAYQIAVEYGFEGSEEEWLESLKNDSFFIINLRKDDRGFLKHDFTMEEVRKAVADGKTLLLRDTDGRVYQYMGERDFYSSGQGTIQVPTFITVGEYNGSALKYEKMVIYLDYNATTTGFSKVRAPNPQPLYLKDADGNIIHTWYGENVLNIVLPRDCDKLVDTVTGKVYKLCVTNGELCIVERS